jgi:hypothetical protein
LPERNTGKPINLLLKGIYCLILAGAVAIVIGGKFPSIGKHFVVSEPVGRHEGDLYRLCEVDRFRETIRVFTPAPPTPMERAEIITLGDSFFNSSLESDLFSNELAAKSGYAVRNMAAGDFFEPFSYPLAFLKNSGYRPDRRRILILESVERSSLERTASFGSDAGTPSNRISALAFRMLKNNDVEYFFKHNQVTHPALKWLKNLRFNSLGIIDQAIGTYSVNPDMLFYQRDIDAAAVPKSDAVLDEAADRVAELAANLRRRYNLDLLFVIIPDKFSVYQDLLGKGSCYDRYIPRMVDRLRRRGVHTVDLYSAYMNNRRINPEPLYFVSDSHYTKRGKAILVDECLREIAAMTGNVRLIPGQN